MLVAISLESSEHRSIVQLIERGQMKAKRTVFAFLTVFLISGFCSRLLHVYVFDIATKFVMPDFILAYTLLSLETYLFVSYGVHWITLNGYHNARKTSKFGLLFALLYLQVFTTMS